MGERIDAAVEAAERQTSLTWYGEDPPITLEHGNLIALHGTGQVIAANQKGVLAAAWAALYACQQCGGTGEVDCTIGSEPQRFDNCYAEHVELTNPFDGSTVYADPKLCEWRCLDASVMCGKCSPGWNAWHPVHESCGWRPIPIEDLP